MRPTNSPLEDHPASLAEAVPAESHITTLQWAIGIFCALLGTLMLVAPHQFGGPAYAPLHGVLSWLGVTLAIAGAAVIGCVVLGMPRRYVVGAHFLAGGVLLVFGPTFALRGAWNGLALYTILGAGTVLGAFAARSWREKQGQGGDLCAGLIGLFSTANGSLMVLSPQLFSAPIYDPVRPQLPLLGLAFLVAGLAVIVAQLYRALPSLLFRLAHLAMLVPFLTFALVDPIPNRIWTGIFFYVGFSLLVASLPWTGPLLRRVDPRSFSFRLAFTLALAAALPLVAITGIVTGEQERLVRAEAEAGMEGSAATMAGDVSHYIGSYRGAMAVLAAYPNLPALPPVDKQAALRSFAEAFPDTISIGIVDATGQQTARSDGLPLASNSGLPVFEQVRRTNASALEIRPGRDYPVPLFLWGSPSAPRMAASRGRFPAESPPRGWRRSWARVASLVATGSTWSMLPGTPSPTRTRAW